MMIFDHLPALLVAVPLVAAPVCFAVRDARFSHLFAGVVSFSVLAIALGLLGQVLSEGPVSYHMGGWPPPWGIEYAVDTLNAFVAVIVAAMGAVVGLYSGRSVAAEIAEERRYLYYTMYLLALCGLLGMTVTGDLFNIFVFLEISSLSTYTLIAMGRDRRALTAAFRYLVLGTLGATFYVIGVGLLYMTTGSLNIADLAELLPVVGETRTVQAALAFLTVGLTLKIALFPLHAWLPNAYAYAPSAAAVFLAATATKVGVYVLIRIYFTVFNGAELMSGAALREFLVAFAVTAMFAASAAAVWQTDIKRMLAYSSVAQIGYIVLGVSLATTMGLSGGIIHLFNHALMKGLAFMAVGCVALQCGSVMLSDFAGMGRRMPLTMAAFILAGLSLIGTPLTVGFVSKFVLVQAAVDAGWWAAAAAVPLSSLLAIVYVWRVVEVAYFQEPKAENAAVTEAPVMMLAAMGVTAAAVIWFGANAASTVAAAQQAAAQLLGGAP
ncbi:MAG: monovalent cation/H+ antiporter subunit D family protein [Rhodospirillales bacterium]